jgi:hypothetical protein
MGAEMKRAATCPPRQEKNWKRVGFNKKREKEREREREREREGERER